MLRALTVGHLESFKSCLLFLVALPGLIDTIAQLLAWGPYYMIVYDVAMKVLDTGSFPQHNIAGLISGITFIFLLSREKPLWWKEINTYTHTHTHTHTHTPHAHTHTQNREDSQLHKLFKKAHISHKYLLALKGVLIFY